MTACAEGGAWLGLFIGLVLRFFSPNPIVRAGYRPGGQVGDPLQCRTQWLAAQEFRKLDHTLVARSLRHFVIRKCRKERRIYWRVWRSRPDEADVVMSRGPGRGWALPYVGVDDRGTAMRGR